jgi:1-acyl-sn-glycerol-3-phosphate acyltransferase
MMSGNTRVPASSSAASPAAPAATASPSAPSDERAGQEWKGFYVFARGVVKFVRPLIARLRIVGIENVPATGPVILAVNHIAWIDIPLASLRVPRATHYMAKIELFAQPVLGGLMRWLGAFPVRRGEGDREALRISERLLSEGKILVIFPEGHRSGGHLIKAHPGTSLIALRSGAPIVPVAISGSENVFKPFRFGPWAPTVTVRFGKPFHLAASGARRTRDDVAHGTDLIMQHIAELLPPAYRGDYALPAAPPPAPSAPSAP